MIEIRPGEYTDVEAAVWVATEAHEGQLDKAGKPYILHPLRVMEAVRAQGEAAMCVAVLHDVVEDTGVALDEIREAFGNQIADAVDAVSRREGEIYMDFVKRSRENAIGRIVKIADVRDNMSPERMAALPESQRGLIVRYEKALKVLL